MERYAFLGDNKDFVSQASRKKGVKIWRKEVLKYGTWKHPENRDIEFSITPEVAQQIADNFVSGVPSEAPIVITHTDNPNFKVGMVIEYLNKDKWFKKRVEDPNSEYEKMYKLFIKYDKIRVQSIL